ncbi:MAG: uracil-DNA glycosylase [Elusimicrobiales bacterium]|jgi:DNA polymerase|nr:uracil-DNA glycosylase [Elusimicrobiales bacterium]
MRKALARDLAAHIRRLDEDLHISPHELPGGPARPAKKAAAPPKAPGAGSPATARAAAAPAPSGGLDSLETEVKSCRRCALGSHRLNAVFGVGSPSARVMFVGEGPGFQEDHRGEPFVGRSGQLLDKILDTVLGLKRSEVYIANIVKCHPMVNPDNPESHGNDRPPSPEEIAVCRPYLERQIALIKPACIVTLGSVATKVLLGVEEGISKVRGKWYVYPKTLFGGDADIKLLPTYHPAALLRNPKLKLDTWEDMKTLKSFLEGKTS